MKNFALIVIKRVNSDPMKAIYHNVIEDETCPNNISSTRLRFIFKILPKFCLLFSIYSTNIWKIA